MERRSRWLGYLAIGLGVLALVVSLSGRSYESRSFGRGRWGAQMSEPGRQAAGPDTAQGQAAPERGWRGWKRDPGAQAPVPPKAAQPPVAPQFERERHEGHGFARGPHMPFLAFPFMLLRGIRDALIALVVILIALRLFRGRPGGGSQPTEPPLA